MMGVDVGRAGCGARGHARGCKQVRSVCIHAVGTHFRTLWRSSKPSTMSQLRRNSDCLRMRPRAWVHSERDAAVLVAMEKLLGSGS